MNSISGHLAQIRQDYQKATLNEAQAGDDPVSFFKKWLNEAEAAAATEVNAMTLATVDVHGDPDARIVLLKGIDDKDNFIFYTNYESDKGKELATRPAAALVFFWKELERQVRIRGRISKTTGAESDAYFRSRPEASRISALASPQSKKIDRQSLEETVAKLKEKYQTETIERPANWGGYRLQPYKIEFWQGRANRLHDRIVFEKKNNEWEKYRIAP